MGNDKKQRFVFIDQFRGWVGILMILGHASYYFNDVWKHLDPLDPFFSSFWQFLLRYQGYLCAPGFLMMNGAMTWYAYTRRREIGKGDWESRWHLLQRGLFLVLVQMTWVNSSWGGFRVFKPGHLGIIATNGLAMCILTFLVHTKWHTRLAAGLIAFLVHPFLLTIPYDPSNAWAAVPMQIFIDAGDFTKYPVIPWFGLAALGSVMSEAWIVHWRGKDRILKTFAVACVAIAAALVVRMLRGYGTILPFSDFFSYSFFLDQKYPPSLFHNLLLFGAVCLWMTIILVLNRVAPKIPSPLGVVGRVPLFFYCVHIAILGVFSKRIGIFYREGGVLETYIGWLLMLVIMIPLAHWFAGVKRRSKNYFVRLI